MIPKSGFHFSEKIMRQHVSKQENSMAEVERVRERERPPIKDNPYERVMRQRKELAERNMTGPVVVDCTQQEWFQARQGKLKFFLDPVSFKNTPLQQWRVFIHDIKTKSGKNWERGDLILLPMKPGGVEHQHFNLDPGTPAIWAAFINIPIQEYLASDLKQEEVSPDFKE
jgi:hypothetical protein